MSKRENPSRFTLQVQLNITRGHVNKADNEAILDYAESKAKKRLWLRTFREAIMLYEKLEAGNSELLLEYFPALVQSLRNEIRLQIIKDELGDLISGGKQVRFTGNATSSEGDDISVEFKIVKDEDAGRRANQNFRDSLDRLGATSDVGQPEQLNAPKLETPIFDDDDDDLFN